MKHSNRLYWLALAFFFVSFLVTRGKDGHFFLFITLFFALGVSYIFLMPFCFDRKYTFHSLGHLALYELAVVLGFWGSFLDEMAGIMYLLLVVCTALIVMTGALALFLFRHYIVHRD